MSLLVNLERAALRGRVLTVRALKRLLSRMNSNVHLQVGPLHRRIVAFGALERLDARVFRRVLRQVDLLVEFGVALVAVELLAQRFPLALVRQLGGRMLDAATRSARFVRIDTTNRRDRSVFYVVVFGRRGFFGHRLLVL